VNAFYRCNAGKQKVFPVTPFEDIPDSVELRYNNFLKRCAKCNKFSYKSYFMDGIHWKIGMCRFRLEKVTQ